MEYPGKTPDDELQKIPHIKPENSNPNLDSDPRFSIGGRLGKQMCQPLHQVSPHITSPNQDKNSTATWGWNSSVGSVLGSLSCVMQCCRFELPLSIQ